MTHHRLTIDLMGNFKLAKLFVRSFMNKLIQAQWSGLQNISAANTSSKRYYLIEHNRSEHRALIKQCPRLVDTDIKNDQILHAYSDGATTLREQLAPLIKLQLSGQSVEILPIAIYHGRLPSKPARWLKLLYPESWQPPSIASRLFQLCLHGRETLVQLDKPLQLNQLTDISDETVLARKASRILKTHFQIRRKAVIGPDLSHHRTLIELVLKNPKVQTELKNQQANRKSPADAEAEARATLKQIAANFNPHTARILSWMLDWLWPRLYSNIKIKNFSHVQQQALNQQLVFLPCHRSHLDYVLLSWTLHKQGLMLPHVAAGENLNIPVIGPILKQGGAIFMRRKFKGDPLYPALYQSYLAQMSRLGHTLEYFLEGGRSRTGRLLPPRTGLLSMTLENYQQSPDQEVCLIPVWIGYDRLPESSSYSKELSGASKTPESLKNTLSSIKRLRQSYGEACLNFGQPLKLSELDHSLPLRQLTDQTAVEVMQRINNAATPTRSALIAVVILSQQQDTVSIERTQQLTSKLCHLLQDNNQTVPEGSPQQWLQEFAAMGLLKLSNQRLVLTDNQRQELSFYRNQIQHLLIIPGLILLLLQRLNNAPTATLNRMIRQLYPYLAAELFLPTNMDSRSQTKLWLTQLQRAGFIEQKEKHWHYRGNSLASILVHNSEPLLARYYLVLRLLDRNQQIEKDELIEEARQLALELHKGFGFHSPEYGAKELYRSFIDSLITQGIVKQELQRLSPAVGLSTMFKQAELVLLPQLRKQIELLINNH